MVSIYSVIWTILNCSLMALILMILRRNTSFLQRYGTASLIMLTTCCTIRMLLPLEFPEHQFIINDTIFLSKIQGSYEHYLHILTYKSVLLGIWGAGTVLFLFIYSSYYLIIQTRINSNSIQAEDHINELLHEIDPTCPMTVYISPDISVPVSAGILKSNIYIPEYGFSETDIYYIILHEYSHWKRKDMAKKVLLYLLSSIMWWNPFSYLLRNEFIQLLEFNCDRRVARDLNNEDIIDYLQSLYNTQDLLKKHKRHLKTSITTMEFVSTRKKNHATIIQRFKLLLHNEEDKHRVMKAILMFGIMIWMAASYYFLPQPYFLPKTSQEFVSTDDAYIEESNDNKYFINIKDAIIEINESNVENKSHSHYPIKKSYENKIFSIIKEYIMSVLH